MSGSFAASPKEKRSMRKPTKPVAIQTHRDMTATEPLVWETMEKPSIRRRRVEGEASSGSPGIPVGK